MYRKVLVALVAILVLCVTAASAEDVMQASLSTDGSGNVGYAMAGVAGGSLSNTQVVTPISSQQWSNIVGGGIVTQTSAGNVINGANAYTGTFVVGGEAFGNGLYTLATDYNNYQYSGNYYGALESTKQDVTASGNTIFTVSGSTSGQSDSSAVTYAYVDSGSIDKSAQFTTAQTGSASASHLIVNPTQTGSFGATGANVIVGTNTNANAGGSAFVNQQVSQGTLGGNQIASSSSTQGATINLNNPYYTGTVHTINGSVASLAGGQASGYSGSATSGSQYDADSVTTDSRFVNGGMSTSQNTAAGATDETGNTASAGLQVSNINGYYSSATSTATNTDKDYTASSSASAYNGGVNTGQGVSEGASAYAIQEGKAYGITTNEGYKPTLSTCTDADGFHSETLTSVDSTQVDTNLYQTGVAIAAQYSGSYEDNGVAEQNAFTLGSNGLAKTLTNTKGAQGSTLASYTGAGSLEVGHSQSTVSTATGISANAVQSSVDITGENDLATTSAGVWGANANTLASVDDGNLIVGDSGSHASHTGPVFSSSATQSGVSTSDDVNAKATTTSHAMDVTGGTLATVNNGQLVADSASSGASDNVAYNDENGYGTQSGISLVGEDARSKAYASNSDFSTSAKAGIDDGSVNVNGYQTASVTENGYSAAQHGVVVSGDPGYITTTGTSKYTGLTATSSAKFDTGTANLWGTQSVTGAAQAANAINNGLKLTGTDLKAKAVVSDDDFSAKAVASTDEGKVVVYGQQEASSNPWGTSATQGGVVVSGDDAKAYTKYSTDFMGTDIDTSAVASTDDGKVKITGTQTSGASFLGIGSSQSGVTVRGDDAKAKTTYSADNWFTDVETSALASTEDGKVSVNGVQTSGANMFGAGSSQSGVKVNGEDAKAVTDYSFNGFGTSTDTSAFVQSDDGKVRVDGIQTSGGNVFGAGSSQSGVSATGDSSAGTTYSENSWFNNVKTNAIVSAGSFVDVDGTQSSGSSFGVASSTQHDVTAIGSGAEASTGYTSTSGSKTTSTNAVVESDNGGAQVNGVQTSGESIFGVGSYQSGVSAWGSGAAASTNYEDPAPGTPYVWSNAFAQADHGFVSVSGSQSAGETSTGGAYAQQTGVYVTDINGKSKAGTNAQLGSVKTSSYLEATDGHVEVNGKQGSFVSSGIAQSQQNGVHATGEDILAAVAVNSAFTGKATAKATVDDGSVTVGGYSQTATWTMGGVSASQDNVKAVGDSPTLETTASKGASSGKTTATITDGEVSGFQSASAKWTSAMAGQDVDLEGSHNELFNKASATTTVSTAMADASADSGVTLIKDFTQLGVDQDASATSNPFNGERSAVVTQDVDVDGTIPVNLYPYFIGEHPAAGVNGEFTTSATTYQPFSGPVASDAGTSSSFVGVAQVDTYQKSSAGVDGWFGERTASSEQDTEISGHILSSDASTDATVNRLFTGSPAADAQTDAQVNGVFASLDTEQKTSASFDPSTGERDAKAVQKDGTLQGSTGSVSTDATTYGLLTGSVTSDADTSASFTGVAGQLTFDKLKSKAGVSESGTRFASSKINDLTIGSTLNIPVYGYSTVAGSATTNAYANVPLGPGISASTDANGQSGKVWWNLGFSSHNNQNAVDIDSAKSTASTTSLVSGTSQAKQEGTVYGYGYQRDADSYAGTHHDGSGWSNNYQTIFDQHENS